MTLGAALFLIMFGYLAYQTYKLMAGTERLYVGDSASQYEKGQIITHTSGQDYKIVDIEGGFLIIRKVRGNHVEG